MIHSGPWLRLALVGALAGSVVTACGGGTSVNIDGFDAAGEVGPGSSSGGGPDASREPVDSTTGEAEAPDATVAEPDDASQDATVDASPEGATPDAMADVSPEGGGVCSSGTTQCDGNAVQVCDAAGQWGAPMDCGNQACVSGGCSGVCAP